MYIYFDSNGVIKEIVNDVAIRKGSADYNKLYVYIEGNPEIDDIWYFQKFPNGSTSNEVSFVDDVVIKSIPYDAKRDMTYFKDFVQYKFYVFTLTSEYLNISGLAIGTIRIAIDNSIFALGELTFNIQANEVNADNNITQSQYDYLLLAYASRTLNEQTGSDLDTLLDEKIEAKATDIIEPIFEDYKSTIDDEVEAQNETIASLSQASPSVFDTASNIQLLQENKGVAVATDTGYIYYWDSTLSTPAYVNSNILYQSSGIADDSVDYFKIDTELKKVIDTNLLTITPSMVKGDLNGGNGTEFNSATVTRTNKYITVFKGTYVFSVASGRKMNLYKYDLTKTFTGTGFWATQGTKSITFDNDMFVRLTESNVDGTELLPADASLTMTHQTNSFGVNDFSLKELTPEKLTATFRNLFQYGYFNGTTFDLNSANHMFVGWLKLPFGVRLDCTNDYEMIIIKKKKFSDSGYSFWGSWKQSISIVANEIVIVEFRKVGTANLSLADKENINVSFSRLDNYDLPDYYYDYLITKTNSIKANNNFSNGISFAFFTDTHIADNYLRSNLLMKYLQDNTTALPFIVFGGDINVSNSTVQQVQNEITQWNKYLSILDRRYVYQVRGNHDLLTDGYTTNLGTLYATFVRPIEKTANNVQANKLYYTIDNNIQKFRIVMLDCFDLNYDENGDYINNWDLGFTHEQLVWLINILNDNSFDNIMVIGHQACNPNATGYNLKMLVLQKILEAFVSKTSGHYETDIYNIDYDFTNSTAQLVCYLCGHSHIDESVETNGVLSIETTCDARFGKTSDSVNEQAFDVISIDTQAKTIKMTRIGLGNDRTFNYGE